MSHPVRVWRRPTRVEFPYLGVQQVVEVVRDLDRLLARRGLPVVEPPPHLRFAPPHVRPAHLVQVGEDAGLDGPMFRNLWRSNHSSNVGTSSTCSFPWRRSSRSICTIRLA